MVSGFQMASILSGHTGALPVVPSRRIAAGLSVGTNANTRIAIFALRARMLAVNGPRPTYAQLRSKSLK
jgi:hypothetical protein